MRFVTKNKYIILLENTLFKMVEKYFKMAWKVQLARKQMAPKQNLNMAQKIFFSG